MESNSLVRRLSGCDWLLLLLTAGGAIAGTFGNYARQRGHGEFWILFLMIWWVVMVGVVAYSMVRRQYRPAGYGFSFQRGGLFSLGVLLAIHAYLLLAGTLVLSAPDHVAVKAWGAFMEEVAFRAIAIDRLMLLMSGIRTKAWWAIVATTVLWAIPHAVSKSPSQLIGGILLGGLLFGYLYYKTKSILLPAWIHSVAASGYAGGLLIVGVYCAISLVDSLMDSGNEAPAAGCTRSAVA